MHVMINLPVEAIPSERIVSLLNCKWMKQQYILGVMVAESTYFWKFYSSIRESNTASFLFQDPKDMNGARTS